MQAQEKRFLRDGKQIAVHLIPKKDCVIVATIYKHDIKTLADKRMAKMNISFGNKLFSKCNGYDSALQVHSALKPIKENEYKDVINGKLVAPKLNLKNPINPIWSKLKAAHAPKEEGDSYVFDEHSAGHYTPVLEGIARMNPKAPTKYGYIKLIDDLEKKFAEAKKAKKYEEALRSITRAWLYSEVACHVAYYSNAKKEKVKMSEIVDKLFHFNDEALMEKRDSLKLKKDEYEQGLNRANKASIVDKVKSENKLHIDAPKEVKPHTKTVKKDVVDKTKDIKTRLVKNLEELPKLDEDIENLEKFLEKSRSSDVKKNVESDLAKLRRERENLKEEIEEDRKAIQGMKSLVKDVEEKRESDKD